MNIEQRVEYTTIDQLDQFTIFSEILGYTPKLGNSQTNTLREDRNPGSVSFYMKNNVLYMTDFADQNFLKVDCVEAYAKRYNLNIKDAWRDILKNKKYISPISFKLKPIKETSIKFVTQPFDEFDINYFKEYGVTDFENIFFRVKDAYVNGSKLTLYSRTYAYFFEDSKHVKLYSPFGNKKFKWICNTTSKDIYGLNKLEYENPNLIVTKSGKDYLALKNLKKEFNLPFEVIAPNSESCYLPIIHELKSKYKKIIFIYDNDEAGIKNSKRNSETYQCEYAILPFLQKDPSDIIKAGFKNELNKWLLKLFQPQ